MIKRPTLIALLSLGLVMPVASVGANSTDATSQSSPPVQAGGEMFDVLNRLEQLQSEVQQLRGLLEEQAQTIADLDRKQKNMYADLDSRIPVQPAAAQQPAVAVTPPATAEVAPVSAASPNVAQSPAVAPAQVSSAPQATAASNSPGNDKDRYQQAYEALRSGQTGQSIRMFESILVDFPNGQFSDNAQYWLAEAYKVNREVDKSKAAFTRVLTQYPTSSKVPDALLKLGYIEYEQQNLPKCREYLQKVISTFPDSPAAHLAVKKLSQMPQ